MPDGELWKECANWFVRCGIISDSHRAVSDGSNLLDFAQILRDGVLLCQLANRLSRGSVDMREVNLRPQLSQDAFELQQSDLFDSWQLYKVTDFARVLETLSTLSNCPLARSKIAGFPEEDVVQPLVQRPDYYNEEIYKHLAEEAETKELQEEHYNHVSDDEEGVKIYDHIVRGVSKEKSDEFVPKEPRDYPVKELMDTERNYVDALNMISQRFLTPLRSILTPEDHAVVFMNLMDLVQIHTAFQSELSLALRSSLANGSSMAVYIAEVFLKWKHRFAAYSEYCAKLTAAQARIEKLCANSVIKQKIAECQQLANGNKFRLQDLLSVPMQRILKYHLLLKELMKHYASSHPNYSNLKLALDAMLDISLYINETKRDVEILQVIEEIQASICDLQMPDNTKLSDYGRLIIDGELKIYSHEDRKSKNRYVFVFDKVLLICKSLKGNQYSYKNALVLSEYRVEDSDNNNHGKFMNSLKGSQRFLCAWSLVHVKAENVYTIYTKTQESKEKWIQSIKVANDNVKPSALVETDHELFYTTSKSHSVVCSICHNLLRGIFYQGYECQRCSCAVHKSCIAKSYGCGKPQPPPPRPRHIPQRSHTIHGDFSAGQFVKAIKEFHGNNGGPEFLSFNEGDVLELISTETELDGWYKGRVLPTNRMGIFPADIVVKENVSGSERKFLSLNRRPRRPSLSASLAQSPSTPTLAASTMVAELPEYENTMKLHCYPWYCGMMGRSTAETSLHDMPSGTYLVRFSDKQNQHVISISYDNSVKHVKIEQSAKGFFLDKSRYFASIVELVQFYEENSLQESFQALNTTLKTSFKLAFLGYAVAIHDFEPSQPNTIELRKGDHIMILNKTGIDLGWVKGKVNGRIGYIPIAFIREVEAVDSYPELPLNSCSTRTSKQSEQVVGAANGRSLSPDLLRLSLA